MTNRDAVTGELSNEQILLIAKSHFKVDHDTSERSINAYCDSVRAVITSYALAPTAEQADAVLVDQSPTVTLTGAQLLEAFQFVAPDHPNDADQLECEVTIQ